jgi:cation:H+ antiporter
MTIVLFLVAAAVIAYAGVRMTRVADLLADRTGMGEAVIGGLLLGASTSLSGTVTSVSAAADGLASLAVSNAIGGICAQTVFLVVADMTYRRVNLEHAAADEKNMLQTALLVVLLGVVLAAYLTPSVTIVGVHPAPTVLVATYILGARAAVGLQKEPMWWPQMTEHTKPDEPNSEAMNMSLRSLLLRFGMLAAVLAVAGYVVAESGAQISQEFGI